MTGKKLTLMDKALNRRWLVHTIFWIVMLTIQSQVFLYSNRTFYLVLFNTLALVPSNLIAAYFLSYYQIPKLIYKKKYLLFVVSMLLSMYFCTVLARMLTIFVAEPILGIEENTPFWTMMGRIWTSLDRLLRNYLLSVYLSPLIFTSIRLVMQRSEERTRLQMLEREKTTTELNFLKTQIHPHFLLNTLNNIYALSLKKSEQAPESILKLSEMLTYVLYRCNEKYVPLQSEVELLDNYIALEQLRYGAGLYLTFEKNVQKSDVKIAPLILLSIVENAFKHGASVTLDQSKIEIELSSSDELIFFRVLNTKDPSPMKVPNDLYEGIGSSNTQKQLELLYPGSHELKVKDEVESYEVIVKIHLKEISNENKVPNS